MADVIDVTRPLRRKRIEESGNLRTQWMAPDRIRVSISRGFDLSEEHFTLTREQAKRWMAELALAIQEDES